MQVFWPKLIKLFNFNLGFPLTLYWHFVKFEDKQRSKQVTHTCKDRLVRSLLYYQMQKESALNISCVDHWGTFSGKTIGIYIACSWTCIGRHM